jgi:hypothetical protein
MGAGHDLVYLGVYRITGGQWWFDRGEGKAGEGQKYERRNKNVVGTSQAGAPYINRTSDLVRLALVG